MARAIFTLPMAKTISVRKVNAGNGIITTVAGNVSQGGNYSGDGGPATSAGLNYPTTVAVDGSGNLFIADFCNNLIRRVTDINASVNSTNGALTISGAQGLNDGTYQVIVSNAYESTASSNVTLLVETPPIIYHQPTNLEVVASQNAAFTVSAYGPTRSIGNGIPTPSPSPGPSPTG